MKPITPCLWFDNQAEEAAQFYISIFPDSKIGEIGRYGEAGKEIHGKPPGTVMIVAFEIRGQPFTALNGGPMFKFNEAVSFQVDCKTQEEVDYYWAKLSEGGSEHQCGWLKDKFGVSWQIVPSIFPELLKDHESVNSQRAMQAIFQMGKPDIAVVERAYKHGS
ncbi:MAG: 3-demethylubiquinone-9 3-methyltransferase [Chthoniobacteraceae bacterium]|nr:3-demethylubiquinone-9 3-methyltransferase [Chthoniobacteraceae bacterium]